MPLHLPRPSFLIASVTPASLKLIIGDLEHLRGQRKLITYANTVQHLSEWLLARASPRELVMKSLLHPAIVQ